MHIKVVQITGFHKTDRTPRRAMRTAKKGKRGKSVQHILGLQADMGPQNMVPNDCP